MVLLTGFLTAVVFAYFAPSVEFLLLCNITCISLAVASWCRNWHSDILALMAGVSLGNLLVLAYAYSFQLNKFPKDLWQEKIPVTFTVLSEPKHEQYRASFLAKIADLDMQVRLSWYVPPRNLQQGQIWQGTIKLKPIHGYANPGGWDYERYNMERNIKAQGYVDNKANFKLLDTLHKSNLSERLRNQIKTKMTASMPDDATVPLLLSLAIGDRQQLADEHWQVLQRTGTAHLVAISGLHVGLVFAVFYGSCILLCRTLAMRWQLVPAKFMASIFATLATSLYILLSGMAISTLRAYLMLCIVCIFLCFYKRLNIIYSLLLTACILILFNPVVALQTGFILSFASVAMIVSLIRGQFIQTSKLKLSLGLQWRLSLAIIPLSLATLSVVALFAPLANIFAIPWVSIVIVPLLLFYDLSVLLYIPINTLLLSLAAIAMQALWWFLQLVDNISYTPNIIIFTAAQWFALAALYLSPRAFAPIFLLLVFYPVVEKPKQGEVWLTVLDVGQGLATVLQTQHHVLVYDAGPLKGETVLIPYLKHRGIKTIDRLIVSHADADHKNGALQLVQTMPVKQILVGETIAELAQQSFCEQAQAWEWDGVFFEVLHPDNNPKWKGNNRSCVLTIRAKNKQILLTGDIQKSVENCLLSTNIERLRSDIVVLPHHGSKTSSTYDFVQAIAAQYALVPAGFLSQYGHPHQDVLANYEAVNAQLYYTAHQGAIHVKITHEGVDINTYRNRYKRWWQ